MKNIFKGIKGIRALTNEPLKKHTSFRIGGRARYFIDVYKQQGLLALLAVIKKRRLKYFILGAGTNVLFSDSGFNGVVIRLKGDFKIIENKGEIFSVGAGVLLKDLLKKAAELGYGGAEFLAGIPGTLGGAIKGNAGAFGGSISEIVKGVFILDRNLKVRYLSKEELDFGYRHSRIDDKTVILSAELKFSKKKKDKIKSRMEAYLKMRWEKQPDGYSAGSFFKNPLPMSAGALIDECGLKGTRMGDAVVSEKHANFILNLGRAKAADVIRLVNFIKKTVKKKKGVELQPEVRIVC
ncbi:MAG: UDP-N-acetylmuramate dehydrogenase [candidate division WOR-3 bacterium]